jgi:hypothetical protein
MKHRRGKRLIAFRVPYLRSSQSQTVRGALMVDFFVTTGVIAPEGAITKRECTASNNKASCCAVCIP